MSTFCIGLINHLQCILIGRTWYKIVNIINFVYYGKTRMNQVIHLWLSVNFFQCLTFSFNFRFLMIGIFKDDQT